MNAAEVVDRLAIEFTKELQSWFMPQRWRKMLVLNAAETDPMICHSHDFFDANMAMDAAFAALSIDVFDYEGQMPQTVTELWNAAWERAKDRYIGSPEAWAANGAECA